MPSPPPDAEDVRTRLARMKALCDKLEAAQDDKRRYTDLLERIRHEASAFQQTLGTHDFRF